MRHTPHLLIATTCVVAGLAFAGTAGATTAKVGSDGTIWVKAATGETNTIIAERAAEPSYDGVLVSDTTAPLTAGAGCVPEGAAVRCGLSTAEIDIRLYDGDDFGQI